MHIHTHIQARIGTIGPCQMFHNRYKSSTEAKVALLTALCRLRQREIALLRLFFFCFLFFVGGYYFAPQPHSWRCCNIGSEQCAASDLLYYCCTAALLLPARSFKATIYTAYHILCHTRYEIFERLDSYLGVSACARLNFLALAAAAIATRAWIWLHSVRELNSKYATIL